MQTLMYNTERSKKRCIRALFTDWHQEIMFQIKSGVWEQKNTATIYSHIRIVKQRRQFTYPVFPRSCNPLA